MNAAADELRALLDEAMEAFIGDTFISPTDEDREMLACAFGTASNVTLKWATERQRRNTTARPERRAEKEK